LAATRLLQALVCVAISQNLAHRCMPEFTKILKPIQKSKVMEMVSSEFYWPDEIIVKLYVGLVKE
jgi:hypothetical protein